MKILYLSRLTFSSEKANVYNTVRTCAALAAAGASVTLVSSDDGASSKESLARFRAKYDLSETFEIVSLQGRSNRYKYGSGSERSQLSSVLANLELMREAWRQRAQCDVIYVRDAYVTPAALFCAWLLRKPVFFEAHAVLVGTRNKFLGDMLARVSRGVIAITHGLADYYRIINRNVIVSYCAAAEPERFARVTSSKSELRAKLGLPEGALILCYTGNLTKTGNNDSYGVEDIIAAMPSMSAGAIFVGVGKRTPDETKELQILAETIGVKDRVRFLPWVSKDTVAEYLLASDILLIPAAGARIGNAPTKMFDYLISGVPIIAADTKPIREVLTDHKTALLVDYKKPESWVRAVSELQNDATLRSAILVQAKKEGMTYTWEKRGKEILAFLNTSVGK
jgi:glycosyltransferase involved in cell wall biosynthesis